MGVVAGILAMWLLMALVAAGAVWATGRQRERVTREAR